ncbi:hypothetical protein VTO73DRAFT_9804 [Trametes versicolor]
MGGTLPRKSL